MITDKDIKKLVTVFATKQELYSEVAKIREEMATKDDLRKVMAIVEKVLVEVQNMRQEQSAFWVELRDHGHRLNKIESVPVIAKSIKSH